MDNRKALHTQVNSAHGTLKSFNLVAGLRGIHLPVDLLGLLLISAVLLVSWSLAVPVFEAPDEPAHWHYVLYLHQNGRLPIYQPGLFEEANSPPLYYLLVAPFAQDSDLPRGLAGDRVRRVQNSISDLVKYWPLRMVRLVTIFFSVLTVLFCYWAGYETTADHTTGLLTAGLVATLPQFTFRGMNISNDALVTLLCAATVYLIVRLIRRGFTWPVGLAVAMTMALAFLSKTSAMFLPVPFSIAILSEAASWQTRFSRLGLLIITLAIPAPWLVRNWLLYGDALASGVMLSVVSHLVDIKPITSSYFVTRFPFLLFRSSIGGFGWMSLWLPEWMYLFFGLLAVVSILGYLWRLFSRHIDGRLTLTLLTIPVLNLAIVIYINLIFTQPQGRYLFPALPALALLMAIGLQGIPGWSRCSTLVALGVLTLLNIYILFTVIIPAYW